MSERQETEIDPHRLPRQFFLAWVYIIPWPLCAISILACYWMTHSWPFVGYVMLLPIFYGYVAPGIATNILHNWHFNGPFRMGHYYVHHGFMYAGNMAPLLLLTLLGQSTVELSASRAVSIVICTAGLHGLVLWIHDIGIVRFGMVELFNRPAREGRSAAEIVTHYAPLCFSLIGGGYAIGAVIAFRLLVVEQQITWTAQAWPLAAGITLTFTLPSLAYRWWCS